MSKRENLGSVTLSAYALLQQLFPLISSPKGGARKFKNLICQAVVASVSENYELTVQWDVAKPNKDLVDALVFRVRAWVSDDFDALGLKLEFHPGASGGFFVIGDPSAILAHASDHYARIAANLCIVLEFISALRSFCDNMFTQKYTDELGEEELADILEHEALSMKADIPDKPFDARFMAYRRFERSFWP